MVIYPVGEFAAGEYAYGRIHRNRFSENEAVTVECGELVCVCFVLFSSSLETQGQLVR